MASGGAISILLLWPLLVVLPFLEFYGIAAEMRALIVLLQLTMGRTCMIVATALLPINVVLGPCAHSSLPACKFVRPHTGHYLNVLRIVRI
jgi:hypothetical protein